MKKLCLFGLFFLVGCGGQELGTPAEQEDLVASIDKEDTGYLSDLASEYQSEFAGRMSFDLSAMGEVERNRFVEELRSGGWQLRNLVSEHIKFSKNQLNTEKLHINLSAQDIQGHQVTIAGTTAEVSYTLAIETIVSFEELRAAGIEPDSLTNRSFQVTLPADPRAVFAQAGESCAEGFDAGELADYNYFYYFKPDKAGCRLPLSISTFTMRSLLPAKTTYPEYNQLTADRKVTVAVFFGAAGHEDQVPSSDEGMVEYREFLGFLRDRGFEKKEDLQPKGQRFVRYRSGLEEVVDLVSPTDLHALKYDSDGLFKQALLTHEIVIYDGHSFYGSLNVLRDQSAYPPNTYQILFMNSCWSYEYYTKQVFEHKATSADPTGWALADVVNDTESGWFVNMAEETRILLTNLFAGCESGGRDGTRQYTWDAIVKAMNKHSLDRWRSWGLKSHEIYGVSGVRTNCYDPQNPQSCNGQGGGEGGGESRRFENAIPQDIPDNDARGIESTITVTDDFAFAGLAVEVEIEHTYIGDLVIELSHGGTTVTLQSRDGGSQRNLLKVFNPIGFAGQGAAGIWTLKIVDQAERDSGVLKRWALAFATQGVPGETLSFSSSDRLDIPDNDPAGVSSHIQVSQDRRIGSLLVSVDISHSYIGDLVVELEHDGKLVTLQAQEGGSAQDLRKEFRPTDFNGQSTQGTWSLKVSDRAAADVGHLNGWAITFGL